MSTPDSSLPSFASWSAAQVAQWATNHLSASQEELSLLLREALDGRSLMGLTATDLRAAGFSLATAGRLKLQFPTASAPAQATLPAARCPWSAEEDALLLDAIRHENATSFKKIAEKVFPTRSPHSLYDRWVLLKKGVANADSLALGELLDLVEEDLHRKHRVGRQPCCFHRTQKRRCPASCLNRGRCRQMQGAGCAVGCADLQPTKASDPAVLASPTAAGSPLVAEQPATEEPRTPEFPTDIGSLVARPPSTSSNLEERRLQPERAFFEVVAPLPTM